MSKILVDESVLKQALQTLEAPIHEQPFGLKQAAINALRTALEQQADNCLRKQND